MDNLQNISEESIDIKKYINKILSNWYWFVISLIIAISIAYLKNRYTEPLFNVKSTLIIKDNMGHYSKAESMIAELAMFRTRSNVLTEVAILSSNSIAEKTLKELDFNVTYVRLGRIKEVKYYKNADFIVHYDTSKNQLTGVPLYINIIDSINYRLFTQDGTTLNKILKFGEVFENEHFKFYITLRDPKNILYKNYFFYFNNLNSLTNQYSNKLSATINDERRGNIITLSISGPVPQQEVDYLNKLGEVYIRSGLEEKNQMATNTIKFIDDQLNNIIDSLRRTELELQNFRLHNKVTDISMEGKIIFEKLQNLQSTKNTVLIQNKYYEYLNDYINNKNASSEIIAPSTVGIQDKLLNSLISNINELNNKKQILEFSSNESNPKLSFISQQIGKNITALSENISNLIKSNKITENNILNQIKNVEVNLNKLPVTERQLINIERNFDLNDQLYTYLLEKRAEAGIAKASNVADNKILDRAKVENAVKIAPNISKTNITALFIGLIIPLLIIFLIDILNNKIEDYQDIESKSKLPIIGTIGHNYELADLPVFTKPKSSLAESFRNLRTKLHYMTMEIDNPVILVSSTISGEGKTFCAINLANILAMSGEKTVLLGLDLRRPKIHKVFNISNNFGLSNYLIGEKNYKEIINETNVNNLSIINSGPIPPNPAELVGAEKMKELIKELKKDFKYIVLDTPPMAIVTDALLLSKLANLSIFVIRQKYSDKSVVKFLNELTINNKIKNVGLLINDIKISGYYGYGGYGGYGYGGYGYGGYGYNYSSYYEEEKPKKSFLRRLFNLSPKK